MVTRGSSLVSFDCPLSHGGMGSPFTVPVADGAVDCGFVSWCFKSRDFTMAASGGFRGGKGGANAPPFGG